MRDIPVVPAWAFVHYDHFAWQVALATGVIEPELAGAPVVLGGRPPERRPVLDCSPEAAVRGIFPGQPLREAQARCPDAVFYPLDPAVVAAAFETLLSALAECSPAIEPIGLGQVLIATRGLGALYGGTASLAARLLAAAGGERGASGPTVGARPAASTGATRADGARRPETSGATTPDRDDEPSNTTSLSGSGSARPSETAGTTDLDSAGQTEAAAATGVAGAGRSKPTVAVGTVGPADASEVAGACPADPMLTTKSGSAGRAGSAGATKTIRDGQPNPAGTSELTNAWQSDPTNTDATGADRAAAAATSPGNRMLPPATGDCALVAIRRAAPYAPQIGLAEDRFVAEVAAARAEPGSWRVIVPGAETAFLESLSVRYLPASAETHRRLRLFGLRWIGQVAAISAEDLQAQFGSEGRMLHERSHGRDPRPINPWLPPPEPAERVEFAEEPATWEALERAGVAAVGRLAADLRQCGRAAQQVNVVLDIEAAGTQLDAIEENTPKELTPALSVPVGEASAARAFAGLFTPKTSVFTGTVDLPHPTADTWELERAAARALRRALEAAGRGPAAPDLERVAATRYPFGAVARQGGGTAAALPALLPGEDEAGGEPLLPHSLTVRLAGIVPERGAQLSLFRRSPATMRATITDLQARWGRDVLKAATIVAPRARLAARRFAWQEIRFDGERPRGRGRRR